MIKEIEGTVSEQLVLLEHCMLFAVKESDGCYLVVSTNSQACKDDVFVRKGQKIQVRGGTLDEITIKGVLITEKSQIHLQ